MKGKEIKTMYVAGRQPIAATFGQGNIVPVSIIAAVIVLFYYQGLQVYIHSEIWANLFLARAGDSFLYINTEYRTLRPVDLALEDLIHSIFGLDNPLPFHAIALGLHTANSILVFLILKKVMDTRVGLFGTLLFTSFYAQPEVVTYHFGLSEALRANLCLSFVILFYRYRENPTRTNYVLALGTFILALGSKESTVFFLPLLMYLVDRYIQMESRDRGGDKQQHKKFYIPYIPFILISIFWLFLVYIILYSVYHDTFQEVSRHQGSPLLNCVDWPNNFYLSAVTSFNLCSLKGPGKGTSFLVLSLVLSFLPFSDIRTRRRIILLWGGWLATIIPLIMAGMNIRYLYITSAFSMAIFGTCVCHLIAYVAGRFRLKEAYVTLLTALVISVPVTTNFLYVSRHVEYLKNSGKVSESLWKPILADFPAGTLGTKLAFINLPEIYEPPLGSGYIGARHPLWTDLRSTFVVVYGERNVGPVYQYTVPELYNGRHPLMSMPRLSPQELERLAMEKGTRVYLFNPGNDTILEVTRKDYNSLRELIGNN